MPAKIKDIRTHLDSRVERITETGCWIWMGSLNSCGYGTVGIRGFKQIRAVHRLMWTIYRQPIPAGMNVLHLCDIPCCCNPAHLFLGTQADNVRDMMQKGRANARVGSANGNSKLREEDIPSIMADDRTMIEIGRQYGVSAAMICGIKKGKFWRHTR